jgi:3-oxoacyl-[acyl-carrier protein] reductase
LRLSVLRNNEESHLGKLDAKVALVSGSGRGIGRAIALKLAREGARVVVNDLDEAPARSVVEEIAALGGQAVACNGDVSAPDFGARFVQTALDHWGRLDIIVNNAGYTWDSTVQNMTDEQFQAMLNVHLLAPFRILRAAAKPIRELAKRETESGQPVYRKVVNISSISGLYGNAGQANYSSAKASLTGLTRALCKEWGRYRVNVNCVAFGWIDTRLTPAIRKDEAQRTIDVGGREIKVGLQQQTLDAFRQLIPLGRPGTPEEAADAVYLLCSPESNYVSGQVLVCGGGLLL